MIQQCDCRNASQDEMFGKGNRMHNITKSGKTICTCCRKTDGMRGKMMVRKHPTACRKYTDGDFSKSKVIF